jgi:hypothetical protein
MASYVRLTCTIRYVTREMPGDFSYAVKKEYMEASTEVWQVPTDTMLEDIFTQVSRAADGVAYEHFISYTELMEIVR